MVKRLVWTPTRIRVAAELAKKVGTPDAARILSEQWGEPVSYGALSNIFTRHRIKIPHRVHTRGAYNPLVDNITPPNEKLLAAMQKAAARRASDYEALRGEDFDVGVGNVGHVDPKAGAEKRQEFTQEQGDWLGLLRDSGGDPAKMPQPQADKSAHYIALVSEQERRFQNRKLARSTSIQSANEGLHLRLLMQLAKDYFYDKTTPSGYATKTPKTRHKRIDVMGLSDLHFGSELSGLDNPKPYTATEESRRFAKVVAEFSEYKSQYRNDSRAVVLCNGDLIEGMLGHDMRDGAPLEEQLGACLSYLRTAINQWSTDYPQVDVHWQPGNHGRNKMRHPGRATSSKWQGYEWWLGYCLAQMCGSLKNVKFHVPFQAVGKIQLFDKWLLQTHGDTEVKLGEPDRKANENAAELAKINTTRIYDQEFAVGFFGHFHKARVYPWMPMTAIFNGALIPGSSQGYARSAGYTQERCGQWIWEAVPGYPVGDLRFIEVGEREDRDASLNKIVAPFRFT